MERVYVQRRSAAGVLLGVIMVAAVVIALAWVVGIVNVERTNRGKVDVTFEAPSAQKASERAEEISKEALTATGDALEKTGGALERGGETLRQKAGEAGHPSKPVNVP